MKYKLLRSLASLAQATVVVAIAGASFAHELPRYYQISDGIGIYLGVLPHEMIRRFPKGSTEGQMHGGAPSGEHVHHVMVALFDAKSLARITDAEVTATVSEIGLPGVTKNLEPMSVAGALTYGNYFKMPTHTVYRIKVEVRRPGSQKAVEARFEYTHHLH